MHSSTFPRKQTIESLYTPIELVKQTSREFKQDCDNFDPSISSSPTNMFMKKLTERYHKLYTNTNTTINTNASKS